MVVAALSLQLSAKSQWSTLSFPSSQHLSVGDFPDDLTGFAGSTVYPKVWRTLNGGITWDSTTFSQNVRDIDFLNPLEGFVLIGSSTFGIKKTVDGGTTWTNIAVPAGSYYTQLHFTSLTTGYLYTNDMFVYRTNDGGATWSPLAFTTYAMLTDKEDINSDTIIATGWDGTFAYRGVVCRSYDGGLTWASVEHDSSYTTFNGSYFINGLHGYAVHPYGWSTTQGNLSTTTDGGDTWNVIASDTSGEYYDVYMNNSVNGYVTMMKNNGTGAILKTVDGINWTSDYTLPFTVRKFYKTSNVLYGIGDGGTVVKNTNANSVNELEIDDKDVYPNPTTGILRLNMKELTQVSIFDLMGKEVFSQEIGNNENINLQHLPVGMYLAKFTAKDKAGSKKIIISR